MRWLSPLDLWALLACLTLFRQGGERSPQEIKFSCRIKVPTASTYTLPNLHQINICIDYIAIHTPNNRYSSHYSEESSNAPCTWPSYLETTISFVHFLRVRVVLNGHMERWDPISGISCIARGQWWRGSRTYRTGNSILVLINDCLVCGARKRRCCICTAGWEDR